MKIEIRQYKPDDAESHYAAVKASINCLKEWFSWATPNYCLCDSIDFVQGQANRKKAGKYDFAIVDACDKEFLGSCGLTKIKTYNGESIAALSYWRRSDTCKSHIMSEAIKELKSIAFCMLSINHIEIDIAYCNPKSRKVAERVEAKRERDIIVYGGDGKRHDGTRYVLSKPKCTIEVATK